MKLEKTKPDHQRWHILVSRHKYKVRVVGRSSVRVLKHVSGPGTLNGLSDFDRSHPVVFVNNTVIYLVNNTTYVDNNIKNSLLYW